MSYRPGPIAEVSASSMGVGMSTSPSNTNTHTTGFPQPALPSTLGRTSPMPAVPSVSQNTVGQPGSIPSNPNSGAAGVGATPSSGSSSSLHPSGSTSSASGSGGADKGPDYVYFERKPSQFSEATTGKATAAKMKLELYYKEAVEGVVGRKERYVYPCSQSTGPVVCCFTGTAAQKGHVRLRLDRLED